MPALIKSPIAAAAAIHLSSFLSPTKQHRNLAHAHLISSARDSHTPTQHSNTMSEADAATEAAAPQAEAAQAAAIDSSTMDPADQSAAAIATLTAAAERDLNDTTADQTADDVVAAAAPQNGTTSAAMKNIYLATYSAVAVFELMVRGIACMRRRSDGYINATQILKIAGIDKARRTKILEKEILTGLHEKVQGGYGKYQGTWIPLKRAQELSATYNVAHLLAPLLEFDPSKAGNVPIAGPKKRANPNAPSHSAYYRTGPGAAEIAASKGVIGKVQTASAPAAASTAASDTSAGPSQQPRFISLRPPPGGGESLSSGLNGVADTGSLVFPRGTTAEQRETLSGYAAHGYTPQGVSLPSPVKATADKGSKAKRGADTAFDDAEERDPKRKRGEEEQSPAATESVAAIMGPSPVKDLNALGRSSSPISALRGARAPTRLHRVALGPPDKFRQLQLDGTRFADRPQTLHEGDEGERRMRARLLQLFVEERLAQADADDQTERVTASDEQKLDALLDELRQAAQSVNELEGAQLQSNGVVPVDMSSPPPCVDLVIDDHGHTALHWSAALAKISHVRMLAARAPSSGGANTHSGNHGGETALHRTVLVSNAYDTSAFPILLQLLAPSLHTRDYRKRTVLHHVALISSVKGRAVAARYYLVCILDYIAKHQGGRYASLIDAQDDEGETALTIVARVGNVSMVKMLLDVGARKDIANDLGLKASDWGIDGLHQTVEEAAAAAAAGSDAASKDRQSSEAVTALTRPPRAPVQKSKDVLEQMTTVLQDLTDVFQKEITDKEDAFNVAQAHLQSATRELAFRRRRINESQAHVVERDEARMRRQNLSMALKEEMGLSADDDETDLVAQCLALPEAATGSEDAMDVDSTPAAGSDVVLADEVAFQNGAADVELVKLRWLAQKYEESVSGLQKRIDNLAGAAQAKTSQCRSVVAMCCGVPEDKVESMLEELVQAIESIGTEGVDLQRLAGFLSKVKETRG